jgi:DNA-binding SARP family transcriptional activator
LARLILHFLGPFRSELKGAPVERFDSNKVRALLVYLAMERDRPHSRDVLAGLLWPEQSQRSAMDNLRYVLANLRRVLGDATDAHPFLIVSRDMVQFNPASDFWLDVVEFERLSVNKSGSENQPLILSVGDLQEAIELYQGSFLEGFTVSRSAPFEEWMLNRREQLHRYLMRDLFSLADYYERLGEFQLALQAAWKQVELEPWLEEAHQQIMRLLVFDGNRSAALKQYEICSNALASELGVEPSDQTRRLYENIRDGDLYIPFHFQSSHLSQAEVQQKYSPSPFFAREEELRLLGQRLEDSLAGENQILFITGEPGSGKTALVEEFIRLTLQRFPGLVAAYTNCNAFTGSSDPFLPFIEILSMLTGDVDQAWIAASENREMAARLWSAATEAVQALIECGPELIRRMVAGEELLARARLLPHVQTDRLEKILQKNESRLSQTLPGSGEMRQSALFEQVSAVFKRIAHHHPLILALDDLQWADADTVNLLFHLLRRLAGDRLMILAIYREEELPLNISGKSAPLLSVLRELQTSQHGGRIDLSQSDGRRFIECLVDSEPNLLGFEFRETLERVTSGIPLFSIELLRAMHERGDLERNEHGQWVEAGHLNWDQIPPRVETVIAEQVARLPEEWQNALAVASVEGDDFTAETVARLLSLDPLELVGQLSGPLAKKHRMVLALGVQPLAGDDASLSHYRFRHHLFQKYFYFRQDIVERTRQHRAIGYALETSYGDQKNEYAITLAHHFELGGMYEKAAAYLLQAGKKAVRLFANERAIALYHRALELLDATPKSPGRDHLELELLIALSAPLITTEGYTSFELEQTLARARKLVKVCENDATLFWVFSFLKSYYNIRGDPENSKEIAAQILQMARRSKEAGWLVTAHSRMLSNCLYYGQWGSLQKHLKEALRLYDPDQHGWVLHQLGSDPMETALSYASLGFWIMGFPDQARGYCQMSLDLARDLAHPMTSWFANYYAAHLKIYVREIQEAKFYIVEALRICDEQDLAYYRVYSQALLGWILVNAGDEMGINLLEQGVNRLRQTGDRLNLLLLLRLFADASLKTSLVTQALNLVDEAIDLSHETQIIYDKPELIRLKGEILLSQYPHELQIAEDWFVRAIEIAAQQKSKMWELRATLNLARLWQKQGKLNEAQPALLEIYGRFSEGYDTLDLREAQSLLGELS